LHRSRSLDVHLQCSGAVGDLDSTHGRAGSLGRLGRRQEQSYGQKAREQKLPASRHRQEHWFLPTSYWPSFWLGNLPAGRAMHSRGGPPILRGSSPSVALITTFHLEGAGRAEAPFRDRPRDTPGLEAWLAVCRLARTGTLAGPTVRSTVFHQPQAHSWLGEHLHREEPR